MNAIMRENTTVCFTYNHISKTIVGTDVNFDKAGNPYNPQYVELMKRMEEQPTYTLAPIATTKKVKRTYAGLTRELMVEYLEIQKEAFYDSALEELRRMKNDEVAYPAIKSWFLDIFPRFDVDKAKKEIRASRLQGAKEKYRVIVRKPATTIDLPTAGESVKKPA